MHGETGLLARDTGELAAHVRELVERPELRQRLGDAAEERAHTFTWDRSAQVYLEVLRRAAGRPDSASVAALSDAA